MTKDNEPIFRQPGGYIIHVNGARYGVLSNDDNEPYTIAGVEAYLAEHPEALVPEPTPPEPTAEELAENARAIRNSLLVSVVDRYNAVRWESMNESERQIVRDYRQALLDWPDSPGFPDISTIPRM